MKQIKIRLNSFNLSILNETHYHPHTMPPKSIVLSYSNSPFGDPSFPPCEVNW